MELNYKYAESTVRPTAFEVTVGTVYLRKDITSIARTSEQGDKTTYWTYQEAALTPQEFNEYTNLLMAENAIKGTNDSDNIVRIMAGQETGDSQQLAIMEAIADLYDAVAAMIPE
jgi:hypothetical protein